MKWTLYVVFWFVFSNLQDSRSTEVTKTHNEGEKWVYSS